MSSLGKSWSEAQCGTEAGHQLHVRHKERACYSCMQAHDRYRADLRGCESNGPKVPDPRGVRNGVPEPQRYVRGARRPAWTIRAILAAEAEYGRPEDTPDDDAEWPVVQPRTVTLDLLDDLLDAGYAREAS